MTQPERGNRVHNLIQRLHARPWATLGLTAAYFAAVVFLHPLGAAISRRLQKALTLRVYNRVLLGIVIAGVVIVTAIVMRRLRGAEGAGRKAAYLGITLALLTASMSVLLVTNVEAVHYPQYAVLALPVFALTLSYGETIAVLTLLGMLDELFQFRVLNVWGYFDFNDIVLDAVGAALGCAVLFALLPAQGRLIRAGRPWRSPVFVTACALALCFAVLFGSAEPSHAEFPVSARAAAADTGPSPVPHGFWVTMKSGRKYHVLTPFEGIVAIGLILALYLPMGRHALDRGGSPGE